eukprot:12917002-Prorocentrum_lima.AAC.1
MHCISKDMPAVKKRSFNTLELQEKVPVVPGPSNAESLLVAGINSIFKIVAVHLHSEELPT